MGLVNNKYKFRDFFYLSVVSDKVNLYPFFYDRDNEQLVDIFNKKVYKVDEKFEKADACIIDYTPSKGLLPYGIYKEYSKLGKIDAFYTAYELDNTLSTVLNSLLSKDKSHGRLMYIVANLPEVTMNKSQIKYVSLKYQHLLNKYKKYYKDFQTYFYASKRIDYSKSNYINNGENFHYDYEFLR